MSLFHRRDRTTKQRVPRTYHYRERYDGYRAIESFASQERRYVSRFSRLRFPVIPQGGALRRVIFLFRLNEARNYEQRDIAAGKVHFHVGFAPMNNFLGRESSDGICNLR